MKIKVSEASGAVLDWMVAKCEGILHPRGYIRVQDGRTMWITPGDHETADAWHQYSPSTDWAQGGPVIEWEGISTVQQGHAADWVGSVYAYAADDWHLHTQGPTPLIAAMRCWVASKLGEVVEVPEEFVKTMDSLPDSDETSLCVWDYYHAVHSPSNVSNGAK